ncbi:hypothetical protein UU5_06377 [Rhodanobacter sp. 115]|nr:hypothetical protein UU5_06377 [Rhodanobacter sp. 115]
MVALRWRIVSLLFAVLVIVALPYMITRSGAQQALGAGAQVTRSAETSDAGLPHRLCGARQRGGDLPIDRR